MGPGLVHNHRRYVHLFVNGSQRSTTMQRPGNFIFEDSQQPNGDMIDQWFSSDAGGQLFKAEDWFEFENDGFQIEANNDADLTRRTILINGQPTLVPAPYRFMFRKRSVNIGSSANDYSLIFDLIDAASPADNPTNAVMMRLREPASGPITGYIYDNNGTPTLQVALALYMDAPDMSITLSTHDLHSKPLQLILDGPVNFLEDGRIAIDLSNTADMPVTINISNSILGSGAVDLLVPKSLMTLQLISPPVRGALP